MRTEDYAALALQFGTPLWIYDAAVIRERIAQLRAFDCIRYAQKACSNVSILRLMREEGAVVDAVSNGEIARALAAGYIPGGTPEGIVFTADLIDRATLQSVVDNNITVNAGSLDMIERIERHAPGHRVWLRVNPGFGQGHSRKTNTGGPHSKHGVWIDDVPRAMALIKRYALTLVGIHMHIGSGVDYAHLSKVCGAMVDVVTSLDCDIEAISTGGGLSVPYGDNEPLVDCAHYYGLWNEARSEIERHVGHKVRIEVEPGRFLTAQAGVLLAEIHSISHRPDYSFVLLDAGFNDLVRPAMYGSQHRITVLSRDGNTERDRPLKKFAFAGPLCEAGDVFTQDPDGSVMTRAIAEPRMGDLVVFHDTGAYGASMSSNYNSRPLAAEILIDGGTSRVIRRRQTIEDLLSLEQVSVKGRDIA